MTLATYKQAVEGLAIPKLTAFLKAVEDTVEIEGWAKMRAPEKRENILAAFEQSKELRKEFVAWYEQDTGKASDFSEWETADLPAIDGAATATADTPPDEPAPEVYVGTSTPVEPEPAPAPVNLHVVSKTALATTAATVFVEGAFEQIVADVSGLDAQASKMNLAEAEDRMEFEHVRIGALLSHIQASQHYVTLGYDNLREFLAAETGLHYRKATYLIANYNAVRELGIPAAALKGVTWSALRHILPIMTTKNYKEWLDAARNTTHVSLIGMVEQEKIKQATALPAPDASKPGATAAAVPTSPQLTSKVFNLAPDQTATLVAALEKAKVAANVDGTSAALDVIAAAYIGAPVPTAAPIDLSKAGFIAMFKGIAKEQGNTGALAILEAIGEVWPDIDINVAFPPEKSAAA